MNENDLEGGSELETSAEPALGVDGALADPDDTAVSLTGGYGSRAADPNVYTKFTVEAWVKRSKSGAMLKTDEDFVLSLLEETGVALVHGSAFGLAGHMRLSYAASNRELEDAVGRIQEFCAGIA